jgi:phosphate starvation-inducible PhoH-like protein
LARRIKQRSTSRAKDERNFFSSINDNVVMLDHYQPKIKQKVRLLPRNLAQEKYIDALEDLNFDFVFAVGPAGTGKTMLATLAAIKQLKEDKIDKIIITRPAISVDEQHGFLPGSLVEKMHPWVLPILDYFYEYYSKKDVEHMINDNILEIAPLAYMRGRTFHNSFIIGDEFQNSTPSQMKMVLTRIGNNSKMVITGDLAQHDRGYDQNGLLDFINRLKQCPHNRISFNMFGKSDVERNVIIQDILYLYGD